MNIQEAQAQRQQRQEWAGCDPFTLVSAAKHTLYSSDVQGQQGSSEALAPLEEIISRFEQQTRASLGASVPEGATRS